MGESVALGTVGWDLNGTNEASGETNMHLQTWRCGHKERRHSVEAGFKKYFVAQGLGCLN